MHFNESYIGLRADLLKHVSHQSCSVLDVGCATGANGKWLIDSGIARSVTGIEYDPKMAEEAEKHYTKVYNLDLNAKHDLLDIIGNEKFDYILLGDVLEHLIDPWSALKSFAELLAPCGRAIISIPNAGHIDTFIHVFLKGYWPYNSRGIFDRTHLRFFTLKNIKELVELSNLELIETERKFRYRDAIESKFPFYGLLLKALLKDLYTFQYIVVCTPRKTSIPHPEPVNTQQ